jgi:gas vesicle protein
MTAEQEGIEVVPHHGSNHRLAKGFIAGAAVGVGLGMLFAPRRGSELRKQVKVQVNNLATTASTGYHRAKDTTDEWAHRGHGVYVVCRDKVAHAAHETSRYVREVTDAVTLKSRQSEIGSSPATAPRHTSVAGRVPVTVAPAQADQPGRSREQAGRHQEAKKDEVTKDLRAV